MPAKRKTPATAAKAGTSKRTKPDGTASASASAAATPLSMSNSNEEEEEDEEDEVPQGEMEEIIHSLSPPLPPDFLSSQN